MYIIILTILIIYFIVIFIISRFVVPHLDFDYDPLPQNLDKDLENTIIDLKEKAGSAEEFLKFAFDYLGVKYGSERFNTVFKFSYLYKDINEVWQMSGYMPCTQTNYLLRIFLVKSGFFKESDIIRKYVFTNFVPHQYLKVRFNDKWLDVDVGEKQRGMPLGKHLKYFG